MVNKFRQFWTSLVISFFFSLKKVDDELKADPIDLFKTELRAEIRSSMDMFDENYVQHFYEILKKADKFLRTSNPSKIQRTAGKYGLNYGMKDQHGRRFEHYGFFDDKHKYHGKSLKEVRELEIKEKQLDEDNFPVVVMFQNKKEFSMVESFDIVLKNNGLSAPELDELAKMKKFPLTIVRDKPVANRIEQLTEYLHVKHITEEIKLLEFFIPKKFRLETVSNDDPIFKELINIKQVWFKDEYGDRNSYRVTDFYKRSEYNKYTQSGELNPSGFDIIKFKVRDIIEFK
jgi:hypothetical protein